MDAELRRYARRAATEGTEEAYAALGHAFLRSHPLEDPRPAKFRHLGANKIEMETRTHRILLSYGIPVAFQTLGGIPRYFKTAHKHSRTTSKHVNSWAPRDAETLPQVELDALLDF